MKEFVFGNVRVQLLSEEVVRIEYAKKGKFCDGETLLIGGKANFKQEVKCKSYANYVVFGDYSLSVPEGARGLSGITLAQNGTNIYRYKKTDCNPSLPAADKTPEVFALSDNPRTVIPEGGYAYRKLKNCGFKTEDRVQDVYILLCGRSANKLAKLYSRLTGRRELSPLAAYGVRRYAENFEAAETVLAENAAVDDLIIENADGELKVLKKLVNKAHARGALVCVRENGEAPDLKTAFDPREVKSREKEYQTLFKQGVDYVLPAKPAGRSAEECGGQQKYICTQITDRFYGGARRPLNLSGEAFTAEASLNYSLLPVIYACAYLNYSDGVPLLKPLGWEYPSDKRALRCAKGYMLGKNLLFAGEENTEIYLPKGRWLNASSGKISVGGKTVAADNGGIFVRLGGVLPLAYAADNAISQRWDRLVFDYYPDREACDEGFIYEDDGVSSAYKHGAFRKCGYSAGYDEFSNAFKIVLKAGEGCFGGERYVEKRKITVKFHLLAGAGSVKKVTVNGGELFFERHAKDGGAKPLTAEKSAPDGATVTVEVFAEVKNDYEIKFYI